MNSIGFKAAEIGTFLKCTDPQDEGSLECPKNINNNFFKLLPFAFAWQYYSNHLN